VSNEATYSKIRQKFEKKTLGTSWVNLIVYLAFIMLDTVTAPYLTFSSINCNSLNVSDLGSLHHLVKLYGIAKLKTDVIFLSDIRLCNAQGVSNFIKVQDTFPTNPYRAYNCHFNSKSNKRGVGILLKNDSDFSVLQELKREDDNSILLKVSYKGSVFIFASIYGPNTHCPAFFENLAADLISLGDHPEILGGDWNCTVSSLPPQNNPDVLNMNSIPNKRNSEYLSTMCDSINLTEPFRAKFPNRREFTYRPSDPTKRNRPRIDFFLISKQLLNSVTNISICANLQSKVFDHKAVFLSFVPVRKEGIARPTISHTILRDPDLDLVVALAVAETYLASMTIRNDINVDALLRGVGNGFDGLRRAGPNEVHINPGDRSEAESLIREGIIANICELLDDFPFALLRDGPLNIGNDLFMEGLMNNVRNYAVSHQSFMLKTAKSKIKRLLERIRILQSDPVQNFDELNELELFLNNAVESERA
jgi:exonuclease III